MVGGGDLRLITFSEEPLDLSGASHLRTMQDWRILREWDPEKNPSSKGRDNDPRHQ